jgi:hypothetical protein
MTAMMIYGGKRVAAGGARLKWHITPIADIDLIARNTPKEELRGCNACLLARVDDVATDLFVALQL